MTTTSWEIHKLLIRLWCLAGGSC